MRDIAKVDFDYSNLMRAGEYSEYLSTELMFWQGEKEYETPIKEILWKPFNAEDFKESLI